MKWRVMTRLLDAGATITREDENDLLRWEEGYGPLNRFAIERAWLLWFRALQVSK